jgi:hypothetical protein
MLRLAMSLGSVISVSSEKAGLLITDGNGEQARAESIPWEAIKKVRAYSYSSSSCSLLAKDGRWLTVLPPQRLNSVIVYWMRGGTTCRLVLTDRGLVNYYLLHNRKKIQEAMEADKALWELVKEVGQYVSAERIVLLNLYSHLFGSLLRCAARSSRIRG